MELNASPGIGLRISWTRVAGASLIIWALWLAELAAPPTVSLGALVFLPVVAAALLLESRYAWVVTVMAGVSRVTAALIGDISLELALLETASFMALTGVVTQVRSRRAAEPVAASESPVSASQERSAHAAQWDAARLTDRERQVLDMAVQGLTANQVATRLNISRRTVESHLDHAYAKLGVRSKRDVIARLYDEAKSSSAR